MSQRLEKSLRDSLSQLPRADLNSIVGADITKYKQHDYITRQEYIPRKGILGRVTLTAALAVLIAAGIGAPLIRDHSVYTTVTLDVNAGFTITANSKGHVLKVRGVDEPALHILQNINYSNATLKQAAGSIVSESAGQGYLTEEKHFILISVWSKGQDNDAKLLGDISEGAILAARAADINPEVLGQNLELDGSLEQSAEKLGVTTGRLQLINILLKYRQAYTTQQLAGYNLENLLNIANAADIPLPLVGYSVLDVRPASGEDAGGA